MTHDERTYPEPDEFKPERFLNSNTNINDDLAYGFGRRSVVHKHGPKCLAIDPVIRVCVGRHLADTMLWLTFASVLACFDIQKEKDGQGDEIEIPVLYSDGPASYS